MVNKYNAKRTTTTDGLKWDSIKEAHRYIELKLLESQGEIKKLEIKPKYKFKHKGEEFCRYIPDFRYIGPDGRLVVEDVKGYLTTVYKMKRRMMKVIYGIIIKET